MTSFENRKASLLDHADELARRLTVRGSNPSLLGMRAAADKAREMRQSLDDQAGLQPHQIDRLNGIARILDEMLALWPRKDAFPEPRTMIPALEMANRIRSDLQL